jgi:AcrR family transcriptional regulator
MAASASVTTGALYKHFDGKADLFAAVITVELERMATMYDGFDRADDGAAKSLAACKPPARGAPIRRLPVAVTHALLTMWRGDAAQQATQQPSEPFV